MYDQVLEARVREAFKLSYSEVARRGLPVEVAKDIAQDVTISLCDVLFDDGWQIDIMNTTKRQVEKYVRKHNREEEMKHEYKISLSTPDRKRVDERSRAEFNEVVQSCLTQREWQVVHRRWWRRIPIEQIADEMGCTHQNVSFITQRALRALRQALHSMEIYRHTWRDWYYKSY